ncbi:Kinesin-like protein KIN-1 [Linum perenne]
MNQDNEASPSPKKQTANVTVCSRFRPLSSKERRDNGGRVCVRRVDDDTFVLKDEKDEEFSFSFDKVFYEDSMQADVYEFLALPIVKDAVNGVNGTIIAYGQTGAGKTYSMEGPDVLQPDDMKKGLLPRVVDGLFDHIASAGDSSKFKIKLSMVEIYMERVRDLFDLAKDNLLIKQSKENGMLVSGVTEIHLSDTGEALRNLQAGILNRAVGETQMNLASSRSHCAYIFTVQQELTRERTRTGKLVLVDLAGSEKVEKTGAEGKLLEEAKTINKSLSALGNVINALTCSSSKPSHIPYRDSKLTRLLQDALGGHSRTALICCCSPSSSNSSETLSTLRFGQSISRHHLSSSTSSTTTRMKKNTSSSSPTVTHTHEVESHAPKNDECRQRILAKLSERLDEEDVNLLEEILVLEGILFDPTTAGEEEDSESEYEDVASRTISLLQQSLQELMITCEELKSENKALKARIASGRIIEGDEGNGNFVQEFVRSFSFLFRWIWSEPVKSEG